MKWRRKGVLLGYSGSLFPMFELHISYLKCSICSLLMLSALQNCDIVVV